MSETERAPIDQTQLSQAIEELVNDTTMPIDERVARLHRLAEEFGVAEETDREGYFDPLREQFNEALSILAVGGHTYAPPEEEDGDR